MHQLLSACKKHGAARLRCAAHLLRAVRAAPLLVPLPPRHVRLHQARLLLAHAVLRRRLARLAMDQLLPMRQGWKGGRQV